MVKFISFGCWNNYGCAENSGLRNVINKAIDVDKHDNVDFYIINGDNSYKKKIKIGVKEKKVIDIPYLTNGFQCLNELGKDVYVLLGNHDLEKTENCKILTNENIISKKINSDSGKEKIHLPKEITTFKEFGDNALIIMIDTSIYANVDPSCYKVIIKNHNDTLSKNKQIQLLKNKQSELIKSKLNTKKYKNIIICGHHPLIGYKSSIGITTIYNIDLYKLLIDVINPNVIPDANFYYLCADIHNYQQGQITITHKKIMKKTYHL